MQAKILRVLQEKNVERLGGTYSIKVDVRIIAASNKNLVDLVTGKKFREDLFYRLSVFPVRIPPLRERKEDIPLLVEYTTRKLRGKQKLSPEAAAKMEKYDWPGNIRELENTIERALILTKDVIRPGHVLLPETQKSEDILGDVTTLKEAGSRGQESAEAALIKKMLRETKNNKSEAARRLKVSYKTLLNRITDYEKKGLL